MVIKTSELHVYIPENERELLLPPDNEGVRARIALEHGPFRPSERPIVYGSRLEDLIEWEAENIIEVLKANGARNYQLDWEHPYLVIRNFPLPSAYSERSTDMLIHLGGYPDKPPVGFYYPKHTKSLNHLREKLNVFGDANQPYSDKVEELEGAGWLWVCLRYKEFDWRFDHGAPHRGDTLGGLVANIVYELKRRG